MRRKSQYFFRGAPVASADGKQFLYSRDSSPLASRVMLAELSQ
ncbi:MAG TPA: hypothetical protein VF599_21450 [Pyrinomonadaceae bacterium]